MSEFLVAAREKLRSAVADIDARLFEIEAEATELSSTRVQLLVLIDGGAPVAAEPERISGGRNGVAKGKPAANLQPPAPRRRKAFVVEIDERVMRTVGNALTSSFKDLEQACSKYSALQLKRSVARLVRDGAIVRTGKTAATRYHLPTGRGKKSKPADDDGHGAVRLPTGAGLKVGVDDGPMDDNHPDAVATRPPADALPCAGPTKLGGPCPHGKVFTRTSRPPRAWRCPDCRLAVSRERQRVAVSEEGVRLAKINASLPPEHSLEGQIQRRVKHRDEDEIAALSPDDKFEDSLGKGSIAHTVETDDVEEPSDVLADAADDDVDIEPPYRTPVKRPELRQPRAGTKAARAASPTKERVSWWLRPDADFEAEAQRMRESGKSMKVPAENMILGMHTAMSR